MSSKCLGQEIFCDSLHVTYGVIYSGLPGLSPCISTYLPVMYLTVHYILSYSVAGTVCYSYLWPQHLATLAYQALCSERMKEMQGRYVYPWGHSSMQGSDNHSSNEIREVKKKPKLLKAETGKYNKNNSSCQNHTWRK